MNTFFYSGIFRKVSYKEGSGFIFKVGAKRDYKDKNTNKYEYDNITFIIPSYSDKTIKFVNTYVKDGDFVEVEGHFHSYTTEKDGTKVYHEDKICDTLRPCGSKKSATEGKEEDKDSSKGGIPEGFEVVDEECPW